MLYGHNDTQVEGVDFHFREKMRGVVEYMQYREMPAEIKRKVGRGHSRARRLPPMTPMTHSHPPPSPLPLPPFPRSTFPTARRCGASSRCAGGSRRSSSTSRGSCGTCTGRSAPGFCGTWGRRSGRSSRYCRFVRLASAARQARAPCAILRSRRQAPLFTEMLGRGGVGGLFK